VGTHISDALANFLKLVDPKRHHTTKGRYEADPIINWLSNSSVTCAFAIPPRRIGNGLTRPPPALPRPRLFRPRQLRRYSAASNMRVRMAGTALRERADEERKLAVSRLKCSRAIAVLALVPLVVAVGLSWYAPRAASSSLLITRADGSTLCFKPASTAPIALDLGEVAALESVTICPNPPAP